MAAGKNGRKHRQVSRDLTGSGSAAQARDIERINAAADRLNAEAEDVLEYQAPWQDDE
jgi:hypothetical protein